MNTEYAKAIADWHYEGTYAFYDFRQDPDDLAELFDLRSRQGRYFTGIHADQELTGFFCFEPDGKTMELGLGLKPGEPGKGLGSAFVKAGLDFTR